MSDWGDGDVNNLADVKVNDDAGFGDSEWGGGGGGGGGSRGGRGRGGGGRGGRGRGGGGCRNGDDDGSRGGGCYKCHEDGHMARDCPSEASGGGGGGGDRACFKCKEVGHMSRECPNEAVGGGGGGGDRACFKCKETGHMSRECPNEAVGGGGGDRACFKCKEMGHMSRECPNEAVGGGGGGGDRACFKCKQVGHMSRECPNDAVAGEDGEEPKERPPVYIPAAELEGEEAFDERNKYFKGSGINFSKYDEIPYEISGNGKVSSIVQFKDLRLREILLGNIAKIGYTTPTPIQRHASPQFVAGLDVMACAQTGSGKTAAFLLPVINVLLNGQDELNTDLRPVKPECLVLAPTRELAIQIAREARLYSQDTVLRTVVVYGGTALFVQRNQLSAGCNILVATPGRLLQFVNEGHICLSEVRYFVLDEADRMLDMGFMGDVKQIVDKMPAAEDRVAGMFSATFPVGVQKAAAEFLKKEYIYVVIGVIGGACADVAQEFLVVERSEKREKLMGILKELTKDAKVLVFCNSKKGADFLAASLSTNGISTTSIHGDRLQSQREQALREFTQGTRQVLVATAVAARGLDIPKVSLVVNYDMPNEIDEYVHRIGRTGRVGHAGKAISFYEESQDAAIAAPLVGILRGAKQPVPSFLEGIMDSGYGGENQNGFSSVDVRGRDPGFGAPKAVEQDEEDWD